MLLQVLQQRVTCRYRSGSSSNKDTGLLKCHALYERMNTQCLTRWSVHWILLQTDLASRDGMSGNDLFNFSSGSGKLTRQQDGNRRITPQQSEAGKIRHTFLVCKGDTGSIKSVRISMQLQDSQTTLQCIVF